MSRVPANISGDEGRLPPEQVADLSKDYGARWSDKKPTAKAAMRPDLQRGRGLATVPAKRIRIEIERPEEGAASCDCCMSDMVLATASTAA
jgi:hypothetical protein